MKILSDKSKWNKFLEYISSEDNVNNAGEMFESLVAHLLNKMFSDDNLTFSPTKRTYDGSKDFWAKDINDDIWWAECKNHKKNLGLTELSPTLFMAEVYEINYILFFSYSKINSNVLRKIGLYAIKHQKKIFIYDDDCLEYLLFKFFSNDIKSLFGNNYEIAQIEEKPALDRFSEKNPFLFNKDHFDGYYTINEVTAGEVYNINLLIRNKLDKNFNVTARIDKKNKLIQILNDTKQTVELSAFELALLTFKIQPIKSSTLITFPNIRVEYHINNTQQKKIVSINDKTKYLTISGANELLVGEHYERIVDTAISICQKKSFSGFLIYGCGGSGKTRILYECYVHFLSLKYNILNFTNFDSHNNWKDVIKEIVYNIFSISDDVVFDMLCSMDGIDELNFGSNKMQNKVFKLVAVLNNTDSSISCIEEYYPLICEKMRQNKYAIIIDNLQAYSPELVIFFEHIINYFLNRNRHAEISLLFSINTDLVFDNIFIEFISKFINLKSNSINSSFYCEEISGFQTPEQAIIFINSKLKLNDFPLYSELKKTIIQRASLRPKHIEQVINYLINCGCVEINNNFGFIPDTVLCEKCLNKIPNEYKYLFAYNFNYILKAYKENAEEFKKVFAALYLYGIVAHRHIETFDLNIDSIRILHAHGILNNDGTTDVPQYTIEHDLTADCLFADIYTDLLQVAAKMVSFYMKQTKNKKAIEYKFQVLSKLVNEGINGEELLNLNSDIICEFPYRLQYDFAFYYIKNYSRLFSDMKDQLLKKASTLCKYIDDHISTKKAEVLFDTLRNVIFTLTPCDNTTINELFSFYIHMAENKLHQGLAGDALNIYEELEKKLNEISLYQPSIEREINYAIAYIHNRRFVCGKVAGDVVKFNNYLIISKKICIDNNFWDIQFENFFDEANIYKYQNTNIPQFLTCLDDGFDAFKKTSIQQKRKFMPNFLYKKIQYLCVTQEFEKAIKVVQKALVYLETSTEINYHLFFKVKYLKFEIICLLILGLQQAVSKVLQDYSITSELYGSKNEFELLYFYAIYSFVCRDEGHFFLYFKKMYELVANGIFQDGYTESILQDLAIKWRSVFSDNSSMSIPLNHQVPLLRQVNEILISDEKELKQICNSRQFSSMIADKENNIRFYYI